MKKQEGQGLKGRVIQTKRERRTASADFGTTVPVLSELLVNSSTRKLPTALSKRTVETRHSANISTKNLLRASLF